MEKQSTNIQLANPGSTREALDNCTYYILPLWICAEASLDAFLQNDPDWAPVPEGFQTQYLLCYASNMNLPSDNRFHRWRYREPKSLPLCLFGQRIQQQVNKRPFPVPPSGASPEVDEISLYVFGTGVAFLEFRILYGDMNIWEILEFVNLFRSLRNSEGKDWLHMQPGEISLKTAAERILPSEKSGTKLCFNNPSDIKAQANIFTILQAGPAGIGERETNQIEFICYLLAHGYRSANLTSVSLIGSREMRLHLKTDEYWHGSQDGMVCITYSPYRYQSEHLNVDYHFQYLLLLNQRLASIFNIDALTLPDQTLESSKHIHHRVVELKTSYSFRIISDDFFQQTVFGEMYRILDLDRLLEDLEDGNEQLTSILQDQQENQSKRFNVLLETISLLTIFSTLVDLTDYMKGFHTPFSLISLAVNLLILIVAGILVFRKK